MNPVQQFIREAHLIVSTGDNGWDLSDMHFRFRINQNDFETPGDAEIRVFNLSEASLFRVTQEYQTVTLFAGYQGNSAIIFKGTIKQFRRGRENATDTFLDILASDSDIAYNFSTVNQSIAAGNSPKAPIQAAAKAMNLGIRANLDGLNPMLRGKVMFGMARDFIRDSSDTLGASWSVQDGKVQITPLQGYEDGEVVVINSTTGMIGIPEQTDEGVRVRVLLNPYLKIGNVFQLNNKDVTQLQIDDLVAYNSYKAVQYAAHLSAGSDGKYRLFVVEHSGDTRGQEWYSDLLGLSIDQSSNLVESKN